MQKTAAGISSVLVGMWFARIADFSTTTIRVIRSNLI